MRATVIALIALYGSALFIGATVVAVAVRMPAAWAVLTAVAQ